MRMYVEIRHIKSEALVETGRDRALVRGSTIFLLGKPQPQSKTLLKKVKQ
ncbi:hypothetical protein L483_01380 [Pseudomonas putida H8234]|nr:hypothetical protein L483_01380 [Pseudomonas putida H8234]